MQLLDTTTLELRKFGGKLCEKYAILSHTWEKEEEEVSLQDLPKRSCTSQKGYRKISECCRIARQQNIKYVWVDTCCIDKTSSAEQSEAINSMYNWYNDATVCYAYLADVPFSNLDSDPDPDRRRTFEKSKWFKRCWTLQELLAPSLVEFYNGDWEWLGTLAGLIDIVSSAARIKKKHLVNPHQASIAQKMSWASVRETTKPEGRSYCLLGLFQVNMPILYGEGSKAFLRLHQEIGEQSDDESLCAWNDDTMTFTGMFAQSPEAFADSGDIEKRSFPLASRKPWFVTNKGLQ